jgi:hypothetical protein
LWRVPRRSLVAAVRVPPHRDRMLLVLFGAAGFVWWLLIGVLTQAGFSGNDRYLVLGAALIAIAGGTGWGWGAYSLGRVLRRLSSVVSLPRANAAAVAGGTLAAVVLFMALPPWIGANIVDVPRTHRALVYQAHLREDMNKAVQELGGGGRIRRCGTIMTEGFQVPMLAWTLGVHTHQVQASPLPNAPLPPAPNVIFQTRAQRHAHLLPFVRDWSNIPYRLVAHVRTFRVYASCASNLTP